MATSLRCKWIRGDGTGRPEPPGLAERQTLYERRQRRVEHVGSHRGARSDVRVSERSRRAEAPILSRQGLARLRALPRRPPLHRPPAADEPGGVGRPAAAAAVSTRPEP